MNTEKSNPFGNAHLVDIPDDYQETDLYCPECGAHRVVGYQEYACQACGCAFTLSLRRGVYFTSYSDEQYPDVRGDW